MYLHIEGYDLREREEWRRTRLVCFYSAMFGNSDPKKFPRTPEKFMPLKWDEETSVKTFDKVDPKDARAIMERHRLRTQQLASASLVPLTEGEFQSGSLHE